MQLPLLRPLAVALSACAPLAQGVSLEGPTVPPRVVDLFDELDPTTWLVRTEGDGSVAAVGGSLELRSPAGGDAAFVALPVDRVHPQVLVACVKRRSGNALPDVVGLWNTAAPVPANEVVLDAERVAGIGLVRADGIPRVRFRDALERSWDSGVDAWTAPGVAANAIERIRDGASADWYVVGMELDPELDAARMFAQHGVGGGFADPRQGDRLLALSDWVPLPAGELWWSLGDRHGVVHDARYDVAWAKLEVGATRAGTTNARDSLEPYDLRGVRTVGALALPDERGGDVLPDGPNGSFDDQGFRKRDVLLHDGVAYLFYEGFAEPFGATQIGLATGPSAAGPWTKVGGGPLIPFSVLPPGYDQLTGPFAIVDEDEPDPARRFKLYVTARVAGPELHRLFVFTAPAPTGPWTREILAGPGGSALGESAAADWREDGVNDPVLWWEAGGWHMLLSGWRRKDSVFQDVVGWSMGYASSPDGLVWSAPVQVLAPDHDGLRSVPSVSGNALTGLSDTGAFAPERTVVVRAAGSSDDWHVTRVREVAPTALELYHVPDGLAGAASKQVATLDAGSVTPSSLELPADGGYRLFATCFQPFLYGTGSMGNCELSAVLVADDPRGPWTFELLGDNATPPDRWGALRANENVRFAHPGRPVRETAAPAEISLAAGGMQHFDLQAGEANGGRIYLLVGSATGTSPATPLAGVDLPVAWDGYSLFTVGNANQPPLVSSFGTLDDAGRARARLVVPAGSPATLAGRELFHAALVWDPLLLSGVAASGAVSVALVP